MRTPVLVLFFSTIIGIHLAAAQEQDSIASQSDSLRSTLDVEDSIYLPSYEDRFNPQKALLYSAVFPGLGQVYNKKYWKLPLVYGGFAVTGYALNFYQDGYTKYRRELFTLLENDPAGKSASGYNEEQLRTLVDRYRRERDFYMIVMGGVYLLQIIDAHVDAHLKPFDLNPELQVRVRPYSSNTLLAGRQMGMAVFLEF